MKKIMSFEECPYYDQEHKGDIKWQTLLPKGEMGKLKIGYVRLKGPANLISNNHTKWHQLYLVISGSGTVILDGKEYKVKAPCIVKIPCKTEHLAKVSVGEKMEYIYVNDYID